MKNSTTRILVILVHPNMKKSRANKKIMETISDLENVIIHDLYKEYPDFRIDVRKEQKILIESDLLVFQFPFYWYSSPALLKEWEDRVLEFGFAYGSNGKALHGKDYCVSTTIGGPQEAYIAGGWNNFSVNEFLKPFQQTANLCGMNYLRPHLIYGVPNIPGLDIQTIPGIDVTVLMEKIEAHARTIRGFLENYVIEN